ncbi:MAG: hypothetical protein IJT45_01360 [Bacteroidales bacterium]|nr:hypothetical protein [Bacteroidales bacterium]
MDFIYITKRLYNELKDKYGKYVDDIVDEFQSMGGLFAVFGGAVINPKVLTRIPNTGICGYWLITRKITNGNKKKYRICDIVAIMDVSHYIRNYKLCPSIVQGFWGDALWFGAILRKKKKMDTSHDGTLIIIEDKFCYDAHTLSKYF